jgi:Zn-dependent protease
MRWWVHEYAEAGLYIELVAQIFWVLLSITLHELAHGWAALWQGDRTPQWLKRMSANPLVHMGPQSLLVFALCGIAWGAMPVDPSRFRDGRRGDICVAAAGPAMNVALGLLCAGLCTAWLAAVPADLPLYREGAVFLFVGAAINLVLAPLNLLPIPPLDGSRILAGFSRRAQLLFGHPQAQLFGTFVFLAVFFASPVGDLLVRRAWTGAAKLVDLGGHAFGSPPILHVQLQGILEDPTVQSLIRRELGDREPPMRRAPQDPGAADAPAD